MDEVQRFITNNQHQFGYIMHEASRQWIAKDPIGALTVGDCYSVVRRNGQYHELLEKNERLEKALARIGFYLAGTEFNNVSDFILRVRRGEESSL